ncbi:hypothetical protein UT300003_32230 [Clostridium sardiniense]
MKNWCMTKWCKTVTDDNKDKYIKNKNPKEFVHKFRLLDDDGIIYGYGFSKEVSFKPLDYYMYSLGVTRIEYKNDKLYKIL